MARLSFRQQIIATFVLGSFLLVSLFVTWNSVRQADFLYRSSAERASGLAETLAVSSLSWTLANDVVGLQEVLDSLRFFPDLRYAMVLSPSGRVIAHSDPANTGKFVTDASSRRLLESTPILQVLADDRRLIEVAAPILVGTRHVGWARVALSQDRIAANVRESIAEGVGFVATATVLSLLAALAFARRLTNRLEGLAAVANKVQAGDRSVRAESRGADEVARVGASLNAMLDELLRTSAYARNLIEASLDPLVTIGPDGSITDVNAATEAATGYDRGRLIGTDFTGYFTDPQQARAGYEQVFREGAVRDYALELRHRDGSAIPVLYNAALFRNADGAIGGVFAAARDVTQLRRAEEHERQLAAIVESSDDAIYSKSLDGIIRSWNRGAVTLYGFAPEEAIGHSVSFLAAPDRPDEVPTILARIAHGERVEHYETVRIRKDGVRVDVSMSISPIRGPQGHIVGASTIARNITERKRAEETLRSTNIELAATLAALRATQQQVIQAEKLSALGTLAAGVAHELNNPMMGVMGYVEQVRSSVSDPALLHALVRAGKELERMRDLLKNMLSFSRPMEEKLGPVNMGEIIDRALALMKAELRARSIELRCDIAPDLPQVMGREGPMQQVLINLITNARDALTGRQDKTIRVRAAGRNGGVRIEVEDNGCGIPETIHNRVFDPFFTTKPPGEGTGLGLAVSRNIVSGLGGTLTFRSREGKGTTFTLDFPPSGALSTPETKANV